MHYLKKQTVLTITLLCVFLFGGCYTKLASHQNDTMPTGSAASGRCSDCQEEVAVANTREVCVWERDIFGFPEMRCYNTNYASSWVYFHNTPWWYRNNYYWQDTRGCPPYYYYDRISGVCRYYGGGYVTPGTGGTGGGSGGGMTPGTAAPRRSARVPHSGEAASAQTYAEPPQGEAMFTGGVKNLSPVGGPSSTPSSSSSSSTSSSSGGSSMSKPQETAEQPQQSQTQPAERQKDDARQQPRRSGRVPSR